MEREAEQMRRRADDRRAIPAMGIVLMLGVMLALGLLVFGLSTSESGREGDPVRYPAVLAQPGIYPEGDGSAQGRLESDRARGDGIQGMAPDGMLAINPELARAMVARLPAVVSTLWLDRQTLLARVAGADARNSANLRSICRTLAALGNASRVQVQVHNAYARDRQELEPLILQCGALPAGARSIASRVEPVMPASVREAYRHLAPVDALEARARADAAMQVIRKTTPEMW